MKYKCDCTAVHHCKVPCYADVDGFTPERCLFSDTRKPKWEPVTDCNLLPKLTAEVFDRPDCPTWAKYAAVDRDGIACFYDKKPECDNVQMWLRGEKGEYFMAVRGNQYDASDWQNSLIERPATLPDWCKVGAWVYYPEEMGHCVYLKISEIKMGFVAAKEKDDYDPWQISYKSFCEHAKPARLRPWTFEEAPLSLKVKDPHGFALAYLSPFGGKYIIAYHEHEECEKLKSGEVTFTFSAFADIFTQIDGSPCGVLEHLNGKGEWVE